MPGIDLTLSVSKLNEYVNSLLSNDLRLRSVKVKGEISALKLQQGSGHLYFTLKDETAVRVILQNLINKLWFRTDDIFTIEEVQKQLGREDKKYLSKSISENAKETKFSYITHSLNSQNSSITESINTYTQKDFVYDTNFFTQNLETFSSLAFLSDGLHILKPSKLKMFPYFKK